MRGHAKNGRFRLVPMPLLSCCASNRSYATSTVSYWISPTQIMKKYFLQNVHTRKYSARKWSLLEDAPEEKVAFNAETTSLHGCDTIPAKLLQKCNHSPLRGICSQTTCSETSKTIQNYIIVDTNWYNWTTATEEVEKDCVMFPSLGSFTTRWKMINSLWIAV